MDGSEAPFLGSFFIFPVIRRKVKKPLDVSIRPNVCRGPIGPVSVTSGPPEFPAGTLAFGGSLDASGNTDNLDRYLSTTYALGTVSSHAGYDHKAGP